LSALPSANDKVQTVQTTDPLVAAAFIRRGEVVAFPTETVYGLGADMQNQSAVQKVFAAKGRPADNPLIVHVGNADDIMLVADSVSRLASVLIDAFMPGPITLLLPKSPRVPDVVTAGSALVGVRMPDHELAIEFLRACTHPVVAPSANRSGRPSPTSPDAVLSDMQGRIACILSGTATTIGLESTVVDASGETPIIIRPGAVTLEEIIAATGKGRYALSDDAISSSPGTRYRHYAPKAIVRLVSGFGGVADPSSADAWIGFDPLPVDVPLGHSVVCQDIDTYARSLFRFFRECDSKGIQTIWCQTTEPVGLGAALMDRLVRAAAR
jgi:L-threonylcarbamoyladenylate synthase